LSWLSGVDATILVVAETRPALAKDMTSQELLRWYWLRSEPAGLARSVGVAAIGSKLELTARLVAYLDGGTPTTMRARAIGQGLLAL